jgi:beta-glucosidase
MKKNGSTDSTSPAPRVAIHSLVLERRSVLRSFIFSAGLRLLKPSFVFAQQSAKHIVPDHHAGTYKDSRLPIEARVQDLLKRMTLEEKARQMDLYAALSTEVQPLVELDANFFKENGSRLKPAVVPTHPDVDLQVPVGKDAKFAPADGDRLWGKLGVGAIRGLQPTPEIGNQIQRWLKDNTRLGIPALFVEEALHGYVNGTIFPTPINLAATWNTDLARKTGAAIASEARANGVAMILAPVLDLARDPRWGRIEEDFGEDPYLTGQMGLAYVQGAQGDSLADPGSVVAEIKHFVAYGSPESGGNTSPTHIGERELRTVMLKSMEPAIRDGHAMAVMAAYEEIDGIPVTADPHLLIDILRNEWHFKGFVLSDLGAIRHLYDRHFIAATPKDAICRAINSGVDMQFYDFDHDTFQGAIHSGIADHTLSIKAVDRAVSCILRVKFMLGLFEHPEVDTGLVATTLRSPAHLALSLQSARESMTLLKNEGNLLPLSKSLNRIAIIGSNADKPQYGDYADEKKGARVTLLQGVKHLLPNAAVTYSDGENIDTAISSVKKSEIAILALGEGQGTSGEGFDRSNLDLPENQQALLQAVVATGVPTVLVLQNGRPLTLNWASKHVPAILEAWYPGEFGGTAIAETLFGDNKPAGRLTITFPQTVGQLPDFYNFDPSKKTWFIDNSGAPLFPFGFGLTYTTFVYKNLHVVTPHTGSNDDVLVHVDIQNSGSVESDEVAQLYFRENVTSVETPVRSLGDFTRIPLRPGQTRTITFHLKQKQFAVWDEHGRWANEPGTFTVWAGGSSMADLSTTFTLINA